MADHWIGGTRYGLGRGKGLFEEKKFFGGAQNQERGGVEAEGEKRNEQWSKFSRKQEGSRQNQAHSGGICLEKVLFETAGRQEMMV